MNIVLVLFLYVGMDYRKPTKGDLLKFALAYALIKVRVARHRLGLSEAMRYEVADDAVQRLQETGQWRELNEEIKNETMPFPSLDSKTRQ